jgi:hypothetical protein
MPTVGLVEFVAIVSVEVKECIEAVVAKLAIVGGAVGNFKDLGVCAVCVGLLRGGNPTEADPRPCRGYTF